VRLKFLAPRPSWLPRFSLFSADSSEVDLGNVGANPVTMPPLPTRPHLTLEGWSPAMLLECPGVFVAPIVPEGWAASGTPGEFYELLPPEGPGAIHISVYRRPDLPMEENEARDMLARFLAKLGPGGEIRVVNDGRKQQRAFSRLIHHSEEGEPTEWFTACIVWPKHMLMCSYNSPPGQGDLPAAERMIASIYPPRTGPMSRIRERR